MADEKTTTACEHLFEKVIIENDVWHKNYTTNYQYDYQVLKEQHLEIFCRKCGEHKSFQIFKEEKKK